MSERRREPGHGGLKEPLTRRAFTRWLAGVLGIGATASYLALAPEEWPFSRADPTGRRRQPRPRLSSLRDYRVTPPAGAAALGVGRDTNEATRLRKALDAVGGLGRYVKSGEIVLVKPNAAFDRSPHLGATTNPAILEELIRMLLVDHRVAEVRVADNPIESPADCFAKSGMTAAVDRAGARLMLPDANAFRWIKTSGARLIESWPVFFRPLRGVDKVIGIAPVKDHNLCRASLGMKNWYGLLGGRRNQLHQDIHEVVSDLSLMIRPTLTIVDGGRVLMRNGPTGGDPSDVKLGKVVTVGSDPVALDTWCYKHLLERSDELPAYLAKAEAKGSGRMDYRGRVREIT